MDPLKMYFLLNMVIFHCYVSLLEGNLERGPTTLSLRDETDHHGFFKQLTSPGMILQVKGR